MVADQQRLLSLGLVCLSVVEGDFSERLAVPHRVPSGVPPVEVQLQPVEVGAFLGVHRLVLLLGNSKQPACCEY